MLWELELPVYHDVYSLELKHSRKVLQCFQERRSYRPLNEPKVCNHKLDILSLAP